VFLQDRHFLIGADADAEEGRGQGVAPEVADEDFAGT
jgi:hypothetical protein